MVDNKNSRRTKDAGFIGVKLAADGNMDLYNRLQEEVRRDPEMTQTRVIRVALREYFEKIDNK